MNLLIMFACAMVLATCDGYRILAVYPFNGKSHFIMFEQLNKALARKGHQVDVVSTFPLKKPYPNYNDIIVLPTARDFMNNMTYEEVYSMIKSSTSRAVATIAGNDVCENLNNPKVQDLIRNPPKDPPYDLVILEVFGAHCYAILSEILKVPLVGVSSAALYPWHHSYIGNPPNYAYQPNNLISYPSGMNFWQRTYNFVHAIAHQYQFNAASSAQTDMLRKYVSPDAPDIRELEKKFAMILVNSHISMNGIADMTPGYIEVGGLHVQEEGADNSPALEKWMNESTHGFIYFTFGSMVKIESLPSKYLEIFYKSLANIAPVRVLMKIAKPDELPPGLSSNVHILTWVPQVQVLKHPNIKAFITHGGLMGTQEAIHYGVPLLGIPLFADQFINIDTYVQRNIAIRLDLESLTVEKMDEALNAIVNDPKYRTTMKKVSEKFLDRPLTAAETAVYWVEYIIRHGPNALRSPAKDLAWWQLQMLDIYAFLLAIAFAAVYLLGILVQFMFYITSSTPRTSPKKKVN